MGCAVVLSLHEDGEIECLGHGQILQSAMRLLERKRVAASRLSSMTRSHRPWGRGVRLWKRPGPTSANSAGTSRDRKSTRLNSSHANISYAVFCLKKKHKV